MNNPVGAPSARRHGAFEFSGKWRDHVRRLPETGMGYTVIRVVLRDGRTFDQVAVDSGMLSRVRGLREIPFTEEDIVEITANHRKWDWHETP
jgi:hypothetical protein